jgi:hypothetical protein
MSNATTIEYRIPISFTQDEQLQDLARHLARERGERKVPLRQVVREAIAAYIAINLPNPR